MCVNMLSLQLNHPFISKLYTLPPTSLSADTYAMAGMALQCVKNAGFHVHNAAELDTALTKIKQKLLAARRADGHIGNEYSTGLAVQVQIFLYFSSSSILSHAMKPKRAE